VQGEIGGDTDIVVEGSVEGRLRPERDVTVNATGSVHGSIEARRVRIAGKVEGDVRGREVVEVLPSGRLVGDVVAPNMVIAEGAFFKGSVEMSGVDEGAGEARERAL
jgi:cytoskeletal protein CcmA (bactofilin family)